MSHFLSKCRAFAALLMLAAGALHAQDAAKVLRVVPQADLKILDPIWTTATITTHHGFMVYDTLFGTDEQGRVQPQMVDKFDADAERKVWTFTLRPGLVFHDGKPVTAEDVVASITRWGKRDVFGQRMMAALVKMEALDEKTVRMRFASPFGMVPEALGKSVANVPFIMPKRVADTPADKQIDDATGSGPFIFKKDEYRPGDRIVYLKNPNYKPRPEPASATAGGKQVFVDRVEWVILKDAQTTANALVSGEVDMLEFSPLEHYATLRTNPKVELLQLTAPGKVTAIYNHVIPPFDNPKMLRAALLAINQEAMLRGQVMFRELYKPCASILPCGSIYASTNTSWFTGKPQFEEARRLLKEAGYDGKPVVLLSPSDFATFNKYAVVYEPLLKQAGFNVDLQVVDWGTLVARRVKKDPASQGGWNIFITGTYAADALIPVMYSALTGSGEKGFFGWPKDDQLEAAKAAFIAAPDMAGRKKAADEIQARAFEAGVIGPIGEWQPLSAVRKGVVTGVLKGHSMVLWNIRKN